MHWLLENIKFQFSQIETFENGQGQLQLYYSISTNFPVQSKVQTSKQTNKQINKQKQKKMKQTNKQTQTKIIHQQKHINKQKHEHQEHHLPLKIVELSKNIMRSWHPLT